MNTRAIKARTMTQSSLSGRPIPITNMNPKALAANPSLAKIVLAVWVVRVSVEGVDERVMKAAVRETKATMLITNTQFNINLFRDDISPTSMETIAVIDLRRIAKPNSISL